MAYTVTKAADRVAMAREVRNTLAACKDIARLEIVDGFGARSVRVEFAHSGGISVNVEFDGDDNMDRRDDFCMAWHMTGNRDAGMTYAFGRAAGGEVNPHHRRKCTAFAEGFDDLCVKLSRVIAALNSGQAYL